METLLIKSNGAFSLGRLQELLVRSWPVEETPGETLVVHGANTRAYLHLGLESKDGKEFTLLMDYSDVELAKGILEQIANDSTVTVDNDFGTVLPGDEFVARCKSEPHWNWRQ